MTDFTDALKTLIREAVQEGIRAERSQTGAVGTRRLLTVEQAAEYIGRTEQAMYQLISQKKIPVVRTDRRVMIDVKDLDKWIDENKR
jgi:excisionase family DNA binding protein